MGPAAQGLVNGDTMCQHTPADSAVTVEGETKWEGKGEKSCKVGGLLSSHFVYRLPVARTQTHELVATHTHTLNTGIALAHRHTETRAWKGARHTFTPTSTRTAWLSESSKSQASIQFIREPLAAALV